MVFEGFPQAKPWFFDDLAANNDREWWKANVDRYEREIAKPAAELVDALEPEFGPIRRFRPYRDVRFSADKRPYKEQVSFVAAHDGGSLYVQLGVDDVLIAGGRWQPTTEELTRFRQLVDDPRAIGDIEEQLEERLRDGLAPDDDAVLKTAPRGFSRDHPKIKLLRRTRLVVLAHRELGPWIHTGELLEVVTRLWRSVDKWNDWLLANIPPELPESKAR
jgi:uncharacterized protein (TIGR02453 family)